MANTGFKGMLVKQTGVPILFDQVLLDSSGNAVTTGSSYLEIHEIQSDGTIKVFEWNTTGQYTFKVPGSGTPPLTASSAVFTHQKNGLWTYVLSAANASNFTIGAIYVWYITNSNASPTQIPRRFQYGGADGDLVVTASGTAGSAFVQSDVKGIAGQTVNAAGTVTVPSTIASPTNITSASGINVAAGGITLASLGAALLEVLTRRVLFTGTTTGLVTADLYLPYDQIYNGALTYKSQTLGTPVYLWSNGTNYIASTTIGTNGSAYYQSSTNAVNGNWTAQGTASGTTTVVAHGHSQLAAVQFDQTLPTAAQVGTIPTTGTINTTLPPTVVQIRSEMDANSTKLANLDAAVSSRLATSSYTAPTTPPTVVQIRSEMDANSTKLSNLDATVSSRLASSSYTAPTTPPTVTQIRTEMDTNSTKLSNLDATVSSRLAASSYTAPTTPPTVVQIRTEMDSNSTKLANLDATVSSRLATADYTAPTTPPTTTQIAAEILVTPTNKIGTNSDNTVQIPSTATPPSTSQIAAAILVTPTNKIATNPDNSVNTTIAGGSVNIQVLSHFNDTGTRLKLVRGNDYAAANGNSLQFSITGRPELVGTVAYLRFQGQTADACVSSTITNGTQTVVMGDMLAAFTNLFSGNSEVPYQLNFITSNGLVNTVIDGLATISQKC